MRICDVGGFNRLVKILFVGLLWEGSIRCNDPSVLRHKGLSEYLRYLKRKVWQFMIRDSLVAIQRPLAREPRGLVQDERFVIIYNYCENDKVQCKIAI